MSRPPSKTVPAPPRLPQARARARVGGPALESVTLRLKTLTPVLGGAHRTRETDNIDWIRPGSFKGSLRFFWRALEAGRFSSASELYAAEVQLWGGTPSDQQVRAPVEVTLAVHTRTDPGVTSEDIPMGASDGYALWTARAQRDGTRAATRRNPGLEFSLTLRYPAERRTEVQNALRAWVLFGGYGGRTRRGLGSVTIVSGSGDGFGTLDRWLPRAADTQTLAGELKRLFAGAPGEDPFSASRTIHFHDLPQLCGGELWAGKPMDKPLEAWTSAVDWLQRFRQGAARAKVTATTSDTARDHNPDRGRAAQGRSFFPKPDKVRHLSGKGPWAHAPRGNDKPAWPRTGFGIPMATDNFQQQDGKTRQRYLNPEPKGYKLHWFIRDKSGSISEHQRLASPLIVKAMPTLEGRFVPIALWLHRAYPEDGMVGLERSDPRHSRSLAPFDTLVAPGDMALYKPLDTPAVRSAPPGMRLRRAFLDWLGTQSIRRILG